MTSNSSTSANNNNNDNNNDDASVALPGGYCMSYQPCDGGLVVTVDGNDQVFRSALIVVKNAASYWRALTDNTTGVEVQDNGQVLVVQGTIPLRLDRRTTADDRIQQLENQVHQMQQQIDAQRQQIDALMRIITPIRQKRLRDLQANAIVTGTSHHVNIMQTGQDYKASNVFTVTPAGTYLTLDLQEPVFVEAMQVRFYDGDNRTYTLTIAESSIDGTTWQPIVKYVLCAVLVLPSLSLSL
jgi:hypothetical protein